MTVRGRPEEEAFLCTPLATYAMKFVGTSNSMFLIPPGEAVAPSLRPNHANEDSTTTSDAAASIIKVAPGSIELVRTAPRLDKLRSLLRERPYVLDEDLGGGSEHKKGLYTWEDLCVLIQASDSELLDGLNALSAVEMDGFWRTVDISSVNTVLDMILHNSVLHDWPDNGTNFAERAFSRFCLESRIRLELASVAHPQSNGQVERSNALVLSGIKPRLIEPLLRAPGCWLDEIPAVLWSLRTTPNRSTGYTPFFLVYGAEAVLPTDIEHDSPRVALYTKSEAKEARENDVDLLEEA